MVSLHMIRNKHYYDSVAVEIQKQNQKKQTSRLELKIQVKQQGKLIPQTQKILDNRLNTPNTHSSLQDSIKVKRMNLCNSVLNATRQYNQIQQQSQLPQKAQNQQQQQLFLGMQQPISKTQQIANTCTQRKYVSKSVSYQQQKNQQQTMQVQNKISSVSRLKTPLPAKQQIFNYQQNNVDINKMLQQYDLPTNIKKDSNLFINKIQEMRKIPVCSLPNYDYQKFNELKIPVQVKQGSNLNNKQQNQSNQQANYTSQRKNMCSGLNFYQPNNILEQSIIADGQMVGENKMQLQQIDEELSVFEEIDENVGKSK